MDKLVRSEPSTIAFNVELGRQSQTTLKLTNVSGGDVMYKVKTTAPRRYCVRPNAEVLPPGTEIDVEIILQSFSSLPPDVRACKDKFQLLVAALPDCELQVGDPVASLWKLIPPGSIEQAKFKVELHLDAENACQESTETDQRPFGPMNPIIPDPPLPSVAEKPHQGPFLEERFMSAASPPLQNVQGEKTDCFEDKRDTFQSNSEVPAASYASKLKSGGSNIGEEDAPWAQHGVRRSDLVEQRDFSISQGESNCVPSLDMPLELLRTPPPVDQHDHYTQLRTPSPTGHAASHASQRAGLDDNIAGEVDGETRSHGPRSSLSPRSAAVLAQAPTIETRIQNLAEDVQSAETTPRADEAARVIASGDVDVRSRVTDVESLSRTVLDVPSTVGREKAPSRESERSPDIPKVAPTGLIGVIRPALQTRMTETVVLPSKNRIPNSEAIIAPTHSLDQQSSAHRIAANRAHVLTSAFAPVVAISPLSETAAQRAAVERAGELVRLAMKKDIEIATVEAELAEARCKLRDAKMAVLPAYDVKYEVDESARVPLSQIVLMAAISGIVLKLLV